MVRKVLINWVYGALAWSIFFAVSALNIVLGVGAQILALPFDRRRQTILWVNRWVWGRLLFAAEPGFPMRRDGLENVGPGPYVVVSNHTGVLDIPGVMGLPLPLRVAAKAVLFKVPVLGWYMRFSRQIPVDREGHPAALRATLRACQDALGHGISLLFFPEGTRSTDGRLGTFRRGAFRIAKDSHIPVLPVVIYGGHHTVPKGDFRPDRVFAPMQLRVLPPIDPDQSRTARALSNRVHEVMAQAFGPLKDEVDGRGRWLAVPPASHEDGGA